MRFVHKIKSFFIGVALLFATSIRGAEKQIDPEPKRPDDQIPDEDHDIVLRREIIAHAVELLKKHDLKNKEDRVQNQMWEFEEKHKMIRADEEWIDHVYDAVHEANKAAGHTMDKDDFSI